MNCTVCNAPLEAFARFCPKCGTSVPESSPGQDVLSSAGPLQADLAPAAPDPESRPIAEMQSRAWPVTSDKKGGRVPPRPTRRPVVQDIINTETQPMPPLPEGALQSWGLSPQDVPENSSSSNTLSPTAAASPLLYYRLYKKDDRGSQMLPAVVNTASHTSVRPRSRGCGCAASTLLVLILLVVAVGVGWFYVARPALHNLAMTQLDHALGDAVNQITPLPVLPPPPQNTVAVRDTTIDNLLTLSIAPSNPVQHAVAHITPQNIRLDFQLTQYGISMPNTITAVPEVSNGRLVVHNVTIQGVAGLVMSPDDLTTLLNKHLADAQARLQHNVSAIQLKNQEMDLTLS